MSAEIAIARVSLLAEVSGAVTLRALEARLASEGLTLGAAIEHGGLRVADWLAQGAPGARDPWLDPADHIVAGLDATLRDGRALTIRPAPRRAV